MIFWTNPPKNNSDIENNPIHNLVFPEGNFLVQPSTFSKDIMAQLEEAFSLFDKDGDGTICIDEIEIVMKVRVWQARPVKIWSEPELRVPDLFVEFYSRHLGEILHMKK